VQPATTVGDSSTPENNITASVSSFNRFNAMELNLYLQPLMNRDNIVSVFHRQLLVMPPPP